MGKIFSNGLYKFKVSDYKSLNKKLISEIYSMRKKHKNGVVKSNFGGWHSKDIYVYQDSDVRLQDISKIISNFYSKKIFKNKKDIIVSMIWANINNKEDYNISHTHPYSHYSGVYYVKVPKNSGNLYFGESTANFEYEFTDKFKVPNVDIEKSFEQYEIIPKEGMLYMWQSHLEHGVSKNKTNEDRISISFNFNFIDLKKQLKEQE